MAQSKKKVWSKPAVERLQMPADPEARRELLARFGLSEEEYFAKFGRGEGSGPAGR